MKCKDYLVSNETFELKETEEYDMLETLPKPDNLELGKYYKSKNYISHTDGGTKTLTDKLYIVARKFQLKWKLKLIKSHITKQQNTILDYGCGTGEFLKVCEKAGYNIYGIDPNEEAIDLAKKKSNGIFTTNTKLNETDNEKYDMITLWHVLEHVPNLKETISELKRILKKDGILIIAVPNYKSFDAEYYKEYWAGYDVPRHLWHFSSYSIKKLFSEVNMEVKKIKPMYLDSFYVSMLSEKYKKSKLFFLKGLIIGFISNINYLFKKECSSQIYLLKKII